MKKIYDLRNRKNIFYWETDFNESPEEIISIFNNRHKNFNEQETKSAIEYGMIMYGKSPSAAKVINLSPPIKSGYINIVCRAELNDKTKVIIRIHPPELLNGYFWAESVASQEAKNIGVPTFSTYFIDTSRKKHNFDFMITEELKGKDALILKQLINTENIKLIKEIGRYLAKIHSINVDGFGFFDNELAKNENKLVGQNHSWKDFIYNCLEANIFYLRSQKLIDNDQVKKIEKILADNQSIMAIKYSHLLHNALIDWNLLVDNNHVSGIIDWEECCAGDPVADLSICSVFYPPEIMSYLIEGYQTVSRLSESFEEKFHIYRVRYIIAKMVQRHKKNIFQKDKIIEDLLNYSIKILQDEFEWYGV